MGKSLSELVGAALNEAEAGLKLASARDVPAEDPGDFLVSELVSAKVAAEECSKCHKDPCVCKEAKEEKGEEKKSSAEIMDDAAFAMKLAEALDVAAGVVTKLANSPLDAPGPEVMVSPDKGATQSPKPPSTAAKPLSSGTPGAAGTLESNKAAAAEPEKDWTKDKTASARLLRAKVAQAEMLTRMGQHDAAEKILEEVRDKAAQDPSSPQPEGMPAHSDSFKMPVDPPAGGPIGDNASLISMTKAQARDTTTREASKHIMETPKKDNAVAAHTLRTDGQKISAARAYLKKIAAAGQDPDATPEQKKSASALVAAVKAKAEVNPEELLG